MPTHRKCLVLTLYSAETGSDTIITRSMCTELQVYTSLALCLLPSFPSTMISLCISEGICLTLNLSTRHHSQSWNGGRERFYYRRAGLVGVPSGVTFVRRTTVLTLCRQPDLCPCWEIPQHSWKHCRCDWELCFGTPAAGNKPHWSISAQPPKFHRFTEILKEGWKTSWRSRSSSRGRGKLCSQQAQTVDVPAS